MPAIASTSPRTRASPRPDAPAGVVGRPAVELGERLEQPVRQRRRDARAAVGRPSARPRGRPSCGLRPATQPSTWLCRTPLVTRLISTWRTRRGSAHAVGPPVAGRSVPSRMPRRAASGSSRSRTSCTRAREVHRPGRQRQRPRLEPGEVEDVADEVEHVARGGVDVPERGLAAGGRQVEGAEQLGEPDDRLQRGAQLVAQRREQHRLGAARVLGDTGGQLGLAAGGPCGVEPVVLEGHRGEVGEPRDEPALAVVGTVRAGVVDGEGAEHAVVAVDRARPARAAARAASRARGTAPSARRGRCPRRRPAGRGRRPRRTTRRRGRSAARRSRPSTRRAATGRRRGAACRRRRRGRSTEQRLPGISSSRASVTASSTSPRPAPPASSSSTRCWRSSRSAASAVSRASCACAGHGSSW